MNEEMEDVFDIRLPERFEGPVPDRGFCDRVMDQLPSRQRHIKWPMAAGTAAGLATCGFSLWFAPIMHIGWRDWLSGELSAPVIALFFSMMSMAILALAWAAAEADDRHGPSTQRIVG
ncbi:MAG: hypothetical protein Q8L23_16645 [Caulobacter sp.]|nr:hypothetical protein [Caulobacter sp.]